MKGNSLEKMLMKNDIKNRVCDIKKVLCYQKSYDFISQKNDTKIETYDIKKKGYLLSKMLQKKNGTLQKESLVIKGCTRFTDLENATIEKWSATKEVYINEYDKTEG